MYTKNPLMREVFRQEVPLIREEFNPKAPSMREEFSPKAPSMREKQNFRHLIIYKGRDDIIIKV